MSCNCESSPSQLSGTAFANLSIGKLQRANPLPPGVYWLDVIGSDLQTKFDQYLFDNARTINVMKSEHYGSVSWPDCPISEGECSPSRNWVKFQVSEPTPFDNIRFGFPNIIEANEQIETSGDTADVPDSPDECDINCKLERGALAIGALAVGAIVLTILVKR